MNSAVVPQIVQKVFELYLENNLVVNRRYQRKLVWDIEEKEKFIDSLVNGYPIPLILTAKHDNNESKLEILDGLQRLNAITSFIEGDFSLNGSYFNLNEIALTKKLKESGELKQKLPILDSKICSTLLNYQMPFLTTKSNTPDFIDETFRRINTGGRRLSMQDVRQAGSLGTVTETINKISIYVRKDSSRTDIVTLKNMKTISIGNNKLKYGINIDDIFWVKQGIVSKNGIRESRDEELIAHLLSCVCLPDKSQTTSDYLNKIYDVDSEEHSDLSNEIMKYQDDYIIKSFNHIFDELYKIFRSDRVTFSDQIYRQRKRKASRCFQVIFLALYEMIIKESKKIINYKDLHDSMSGIYDDNFRAILDNSDKWYSNDRRKLIDSTKGIIAKNFVDSKDNKFEPGNWIKNLENIINESESEQQSYDFKMGFIDLDNYEKKINKDLIDQILKTLTAMTNSIEGECTVIVGVAENEKTAKSHEKRFTTSYIRYGSKYILGIDKEANYLCGSIDNYLKIIKDHIVNTKLISLDFKSQISNKLKSFSYKEKEILIFRAERGDNPEAFNSSYYERTLSHNKKVEAGPEMMSLFKRFNI